MTEGQTASKLLRRFIEKVEIGDSCWQWSGEIHEYKKGGRYGRIKVNGKMHQAHNFAYRFLVGPFGSDLVLDHLCRNTICVRPKHLQPVTTRENILRGISPTAINARKTACPKGHPYDEANTYIDRRGRRECRQCQRDGQRRRYAARKQANP